MLTILLNVVVHVLWTVWIGGWIIAAITAIYKTFRGRNAKPTPQPWKPEVSSWVTWLLMWLLFGFGLYWYSFVHQDRLDQEQKIEAEVQQRLSAIEAKKGANPTLREYEYSGENYPGQEKDNEPGLIPPAVTNRAVLITDSPEAMTFRVEYDAGGVLQTVLFQLDKTLTEPIGLWNQEVPRLSGKWFLKEQQLIKNGYCLSVSTDSRPELGWHDAYLRPK